MRPIPEITPVELAQALEHGDAMQVLDIRAPHRLAAGAISVHEPATFLNVPGSQLFAAGDPRASGLDPSLPVAVVCGHGNSSKQVTAWLGSQGFKARSVIGGMASWMQTALPRPVPAPTGFDSLIQFDRLGKGSLGYLLAAGGEAVIIDAPRRTEPMVQAAADAGVRITRVLDTHVHADYLSGGPALAATLGVPYSLHPSDGISPYDGTPGRVDFTPLDDGGTIPVGRASMRVRHTPGHTEGSVTFIAGDTAFTGDFVFIRSVGRPDLAGKADAWGRNLWRSLEQARAEWPRDLMIRPGHYAAEEERMPDRSIGGRWGDLLEANEAVTISDAGTFAEWIRARTREAPPYYEIIKTVNLGLMAVNEAQADELEGGKNECAI